MVRARPLPPPQGPPIPGLPPPSLAPTRALSQPGRGQVVLTPMVIVAVLAQAVLASVVWLLVLAAAPRLLGAHPVVITGGSMQPAIMRGDVVIVRPAGPSAFRPGAVVTFPDANRPGALVTHRVVEVRDDGMLVTKGDANGDRDAQPVAPSAVRGRAVLRVPFIGTPVVWLRQRAWVKLAGSVLVMLTLALIATAPVRQRGAGYDSTMRRTLWMRS
jgi:signal peptidase I